VVADDAEPLLTALDEARRRISLPVAEDGDDVAARVELGDGLQAVAVEPLAGERAVDPLPDTPARGIDDVSDFPTVREIDADEIAEDVILVFRNAVAGLRLFPQLAVERVLVFDVTEADEAVLQVVPGLDPLIGPEQGGSVAISVVLVAFGELAIDELSGGRTVLDGATVTARGLTHKTCGCCRADCPGSTRGSG